MAQDTTVKKADSGQKKAAVKPKAVKAPVAAKPKAPKAAAKPKAPAAAKPQAAKPVEVAGNLKTQAARALAMNVGNVLKKSVATAPAKAYVDELLRRLEAAEATAKALQKKLDTIKKLV